MRTKAVMHFKRLGEGFRGGDLGKVQVQVDVRELSPGTKTALRQEYGSFRGIAWVLPDVGHKIGSEGQGISTGSLEFSARSSKRGSYELERRHTLSSRLRDRDRELQLAAASRMLERVPHRPPPSEEPESKSTAAVFGRRPAHRNSFWQERRS